ncbi:hypothetical protein L593_07630 [Salinarchaeum sp. Harcht-Bsk1]|nr:hypothetical protein L593_07630 [Salinarchaeum sp. Harcht-Bsk1]
MAVSAWSWFGQRRSADAEASGDLANERPTASATDRHRGRTITADCSIDVGHGPTSWLTHCAAEM